jgi:cytochrome c peroxidase
MKKLLPVLLVSLAVLETACDTSLPLATQTATLELPASPYYYGENINSAQATLGRVLFYDRQLSVNNSISCSSCHKQSLAFADNVAFSRGFAGQVTTRNSMPIQNLGFGAITTDAIFSDTSNFVPFGEKSLFWDGREKILSTMVLRPVVNHVEMGINDLEALEAKLERISYYPDLFEKAFGTRKVTIGLIGEAMGTFLRTINSKNTRFDRVMRGEASFTQQELKGNNLFMSTYDCNSCHQVGSVDGYIFAGTFANIGLDEEYSDPGLSLVTKNKSDAGRFKIPSLRNVALTAPFMHDGRFATLEEVIDHYSEGIANNANLDSRLRTGSGDPQRFHIPPEDKRALIAFLKTLTDPDMITDERFSDPFRVH